jgi:hypothetical protein
MMAGMGRAFLVAGLVAGFIAASGAACSSSKPGGGDHDTVAGKPGDTPPPAGNGTPFATAHDAFAAAAASAMGAPAGKLTISPASENVVNSFAAYNLGDLRAFDADSGNDVIRGWASSDGKAVVFRGGQPRGDLALVGKAAGLLDPGGKPAADVAAALVWAQGLGWELASTSNWPAADLPAAPAIARKGGGAELTFAAIQMQMGGQTRRINGSFRCDAKYACALTLSPAP